VPKIILQTVGLTSDNVYHFLLDAYHRFDWTKKYVPNDLESRGFPIKDLSSSKLHNYAYGRCIYLMWVVLRKFVAAFLRNEGGKTGFRTDDDVIADPHINAWCNEMRGDEQGAMKSFPIIQTLDQLIDAVTMCIHIASPQHTAVNYLQEYYQSFVVNKPPAICSEPPKNLEQLMKYTEKDLMNALPISRPHEWLLASHIVHLLNSRVAEEQNLVNYGRSLYALTKNSEPALASAARNLVADLLKLGDTTDGVGATVKGAFSIITDQLDDKMVPYNVLDPITTAVSILI
jgi:hypothetical protein